MAKIAAVGLLSTPWLFATVATAGVELNTVLVSGYPASGVPNANVKQIVGAPAINNVGDLVLRTVLQGVSVNELNDFILYRYHDGLHQTIAREGDPAFGCPPGVSFALDNHFPIPTMNDQGIVTFTNKLRGTGVFDTNDSGVWYGQPGQMSLVIRENDTPPDFWNPLAQMRQFTQLLLTDNGELGMRAEFFIPESGGNLAKSGLGLWAGAPNNLLRMAASGENVDELEGIWDVLAVSGMSLNNSFQASFNLIVLNRAKLLFSTAFVAGGALTGDIFALTRLPAIDLPEGVNFEEFPGIPAIGSNGDAILYAILNGPAVTVPDSQALYALRNGALSLLLRTGSQAPGQDDPTLEIHSVESPLGDVAKVSAFRGSLYSPTTSPLNNQGLFTITNAESIDLLARTGDPAPEGRFDSVFVNFPYPPAANRLGQIAFVGEVIGDNVPSGQRVGIWATDPEGQLRKVIQAGDTIEVAPGDVRTVLDVSFLSQSGGENGGARGFNDNSEIAFTARFTDLSYAAVIATLTADPTPDLNRDGVVNGMDIAKLLSEWGTCGNLCRTDITSDGKVDAFDLVFLLAAWD